MILVQRFGYHWQPTVLVLSFSTPLDQARAQDVRNYRIVTLGGPGRGGSLQGHVIAIASAQYDPIRLTVTLHPFERLDVHNFYRLELTTTAPGGLTGATGGHFLGDYSTVISRRTLVLPPGSKYAIPATRRAEPPRPVQVARTHPTMSARPGARKGPSVAFPPVRRR